ncbi:MAG TPA: sigma 54-interacting transcriptional regulator [Pyrinomonadaceae bacterium]|nr:sigma 54-interacting transcriptional regulator [Pyrinomonadaceae bacterium]
MLHGIEERAGSWEELDGRLLADDARGDRTSLLLGGVTGGVARSPSDGRGLLAAADTGTLFITYLENLTPAAQHVLCRVVEAGHYTPVGDPFPRPINCRIIVATFRPLAMIARSFLVEWNLARLLGHIALPAEQVLSVLEGEDFLHTHPSSLAAAS